MIFVDTNIWLRSVQPTHPLHQAAVDAIAQAIGEGESLVVTPQIVAEFWNVATRPVANNGLGFSGPEAREEIARLEAFFSVLAESQDVFAEWKRLVVEHDVKGVKAHDARIVAAMNVHGINQLMTFNNSDFARYGSLKILTPVE